MKCNSCRLLEGHHETLHTPGDCDACWGICHNTVPKHVRYQGKRCDECWKALAEASAAYSPIAFALLEEDEVPVWVLRILAENQNAVIAFSAQERVDQFEVV